MRTSVTTPSGVVLYIKKNRSMTNKRKKANIFQNCSKPLHASECFWTYQVLLLIEFKKKQTRYNQFKIKGPRKNERNQKFDTFR